MPRIQLNTATIKRVRQTIGDHTVEVDLYAHAGEFLEVGSEISEDRAAELLASGGAVEIDPLDHDGDGRKGGSKGGRSRRKSVPDIGGDPVPAIEDEPSLLAEAVEGGSED